MSLSNNLKATEQYLLQIKSIDSNISLLLSEVAYWHEQSTFMTSNYQKERIQGGKNNNSFAASSDKAIEAENRANTEIQRLYKMRDKIFSQISKLQPQYKDILYKRYFEYKTWELIAEEMNYSVQWIYTLHERALKDFEKRFLC